MIIRITEGGYRQVRERLGQHAPSRDEAFERGARCYLEHPKIMKLMMGGAPEERLDDLLLMLVQSRASYEMIKLWNATKGKDYAATREEYVALADEFEWLQERASRLEAEIKALSGEVTELEERLWGLGGDPATVEPPKSVTRPSLEVSTPAPRQGLLGKLWRLMPGLGKS